MKARSHLIGQTANLENLLNEYLSVIKQKGLSEKKIKELITLSHEIHNEIRFSGSISYDQSALEKKIGDIIRDIKNEITVIENSNYETAEEIFDNRQKELNSDLDKIKILKNIAIQGGLNDNGSNT